MDFVHVKAPAPRFLGLGAFHYIPVVEAAASPRAVGADFRYLGSDLLGPAQIRAAVVGLSASGAQQRPPRMLALAVSPWQHQTIHSRHPFVTGSCRAVARAQSPNSSSSQC